MCTDKMEIVEKFEGLRPRCGLTPRFSKWRLSKCVHNGEKVWKKRKADAVMATARKYRPRTLKAHVGQANMQRLIDRCQKSPNLPRPAQFQNGNDGIVPTGTMAPENTTQYLMNIAYRDLLSFYDDKTLPSANPDCVIDLSVNGQPAHLYEDTLSPQNVYASLDCNYESSFEFQRRDFENAFQLCSST